MRRHRRLIALRGDGPTTAAQAARVVAKLPPEAVLWVGDAQRAPAGVTTTTHVGARRLLGGAWDAVVLDLHGGPRPDALGACHGFVWGGGALILRLPPVDDGGAAGQERLAVLPYGPADVGRRYRDRFERALARAALTAPSPLEPAPHAVAGSPDQAAVVASLTSLLTGARPAAAALLSDRGRGKSSALGLALAAASERAPLRVAVTAGRPAAAREVFRFALGDPEPPSDGPLRFVPPTALAQGQGAWDAIVVDEAAQLPVPLLRRLVAAHPRARLVFATTTRGYEGTGRGFALRLLPALEAGPRPVTRLTMEAPIRWAPGDPVERFTFDALLLDAAPHPVDPAAFDPDRVRAARLARDDLARDERLLRGVFGLLIHAHYRTTPGDLHRLLDAPNLAVHALLHEGDVVAATLVAEEGGLPDDVLDALVAGRSTLRGHALTDNLVLHLGRRDAGALRLRRSMRIAVHPALRRRGLGTRLVDHVHAHHAAAAPDLFGTVFGGTPGLLRFRRSVGYELVRVASSRGERAGEPSVTMLRPVSERGRALLSALREELARDLPMQLELLAGADSLPLEQALTVELLRELPAASPRSAAAHRAVVASFSHGPRTFESTCVEVARFARRHRAALAGLSASERALIEARVLAGASWAEASRAAGLPAPHVAMRALRRAFRKLVDLVTGPAS